MLNSNCYPLSYKEEGKNKKNEKFLREKKFLKTIGHTHESYECTKNNVIENFILKTNR